MNRLLGMDIRELMNIKVVSATRSQQQLSDVAENITVVTAADIELMNAHTLAEVLNTLVGVDVYDFGGQLGLNTSGVTFQNADAAHVTGMIDGVPINSIGSGFPVMIMTLPVQIIDRIEIIKGPASSTWGSALGGVINVITKSGSDSKLFNGTLSSSYGDSGTGDYRAELYGSKDKVEYYLYAGNFQTDGLQPGFDAMGTSLFSKLAYNLSPDTKIQGGLYYNRGRTGEGWDVYPDPTTYYSDRSDWLLGNLSLTSKLSQTVGLDMSLYTMDTSWKSYTSQAPGTAPFFYYYHSLEQHSGGSAKVMWTTGINTAVVGVDYEKGIDKSAGLAGGRHSLDREDVFINDTIKFGRFALTPGLRFDDSNAFGSFVSPSFGAIYKVTDDTLIRATVARGFNDPNLSARFGSSGGYYVASPSLKVEEVTSYQVGVETTALSPVWLKVSLFRHDVSKAIEEVAADSTGSTWTYANLDKVRHQGIEAEFRANPISNTSLFGGVTYTDSRDFASSTVEQEDPNFTFRAGVKYDNDNLFRAVLQGRYTWWDSTWYDMGAYNAMIFDLSIAKTLYRQKDRACDIFFTAHNIFDGSQYIANYWPNPGRWFEGGVRYKF